MAAIVRASGLRFAIAALIAVELLTDLYPLPVEREGASLPVPR